MGLLNDATFREIRLDHAPDAARLLRRFVAIGRGRRRPLVHLQHNPDPDAIASGVGLQHLLRRLFDLEAPLVHTGQMGRAENRAMLRWLRIQLMPSYKIRYADHDLLMVVDTHPGAGTCRLPEGVVPDVVIDHHPVAGASPDDPMAGVALPFLDSRFGATASMVGWLLLQNGVPIDERVATALAYGIKTDTMDLTRCQGEVDERVYRDLYALADKRLLSRIERARLPQDYFVLLERGLRRAQVTDFAVTTYLGEVGHTDSVAEMADILFRLEGMKWALVAGHNPADRAMYLSLRASQAEGVDAGGVAREISDGNGGGHETFAGAQIPMSPEEEANPVAVYERVWSRFIEKVRAKKTLARPLTLAPDTE
jgi:nanoRNase/pAp phosphatase (c-di-AMP/oligoRNAs hydrolase)